MRGIEWLPSKNLRNPLPFTAALWSRLAESCVMAIFMALVLIASCLLNEIAIRANEINENFSSTNVDDKFCTSLNNWLGHYNSICTFIDHINHCFGIVLLIQTAHAFSSPIFEFNEILLSKGQDSRLFLEFSYAILRFFVSIVLPSYLVQQRVGLCELYTIRVKLNLLLTFVLNIYKINELSGTISQTTLFCNSEDLKLQVGRMLNLSK